MVNNLFTFFSILHIISRNYMVKKHKKNGNICVISIVNQLIVVQGALFSPFGKHFYTIFYLFYQYMRDDFKTCPHKKIKAFEFLTQRLLKLSFNYFCGNAIL